MKHIIRFGVVGGVLSLAASCIPFTGLAAEGPSKVMIIEVSPQSSGSASEEFVELYNPGSEAVDVTGWRLQYRSAASAPEKSWTTKTMIGCPTAKVCTGPAVVTIAPNSKLRLSSFESIEAALPLSPGMATKGGQLRLVDSAKASIAQDMVGYGSAAVYEGVKGAAVSPEPGRSIMRKQDSQDKYLDTNDNATDFELQSDACANDTTADSQYTDISDSVVQTIYKDVEITEVLPDPASPQLDSDDEFIELYNPYDVEVDLEGYVLKTGETWSRKYVIHDVVMAPHEYVTFTSSQTHLTLANDGSGVRLYGPDDTLLYEVPSYGKAKTGSSWVRDANGQWVWTTEPTANGPNVVAQPVETDSKTSKTTTAKKSTSSKSKTTAAKKAAVAKTPGVVKAAATTAPSAAQSAAAGANAWPFALLGVGALAGGYAIFEYRHEIGGFARKAWQAMPGVGGKK